MRKDISMLLIFVVAFHLSSYKLHVLVLKEEYMWLIHDVSQTLVLCFLFLLSGCYSYGIFKKILHAWAFFLLGEALDRIYFYKLLSFNFGFIVFSLYVFLVYMNYWKNTKESKNNETNKSSNNI